MTVGTTTHINLGGHEYLVRQGSYIKRQAPMFGPRFSTGDPDFNSLSFWQHWAQNCFIGGVDQDEFADDAMYDEGVGVDTTMHEKVVLSHDLLRGTGSNWALSNSTANGDQGSDVCVYNSKLYVLNKSSAGTLSHLYEYDPATDGWTRITGLDTRNIVARSIASFDGKLWVGGYSTGGSNIPRLAFASGSLATWSAMSMPTFAPTVGVYAIRAFQQRLYVAFGTQIGRIKDDMTWDGSVPFYKADMNSDSNFINDMEVHLGFLYMLSANGHIHRTDGNSTFDIWSWDGQTQGVALKSFDGRLFILTFEYSNTADVGYGCLYQMSGSAVTQLKRWGDETSATRIGSMCVFDRHLYYGASNLLGFGARPGFGVAVYDPIEDAHSIFAANSDTTSFPRGSTPFSNHLVDAQIQFNGSMFAIVRKYGAFRTPYKPPMGLKLGLHHFDVSSAGGSLASKNGGWFTTSTYDAGTPGVLKLWRKIVVETTIVANTGVVVEYSTNNGTSYTSLTGISAVNTRTKTEFWLNNIKSTSIKLRFTLRSTSQTATPIFYGFVLSYIPVPEPNWLWTFTIVLSEKLASSDNTVTLSTDTEAEVAFLSALHRTHNLTTFTDVDGLQWATGGNPGVFIYDIEFRMPDLTQPLEAFVVVTLLEAVETY